MPFNINPLSELFILIGGPLFQTIAFLILLFLFKNYHEVIKVYYFKILFFNLLPIYPLDGGKICNILFQCFIPFKKSLQTVIKFSYFIIFILVLKINSFKLNYVIMIILLLVLIYLENKKINYYYQKFLLERYLNNYNFKFSKIINNPDNFYRQRKHLINDSNKYYLEKEYLSKKFKSN